MIRQGDDLMHVVTAVESRIVDMSYRIFTHEKVLTSRRVTPGE